jgi:hypothetical protein
MVVMNPTAPSHDPDASSDRLGDGQGGDADNGQGDAGTNASPEAALPCRAGRAHPSRGGRGDSAPVPSVTSAAPSLELLGLRCPVCRSRTRVRNAYNEDGSVVRLRKCRAHGCGRVEKTTELPNRVIAKLHREIAELRRQQASPGQQRRAA